MKVKYSDREVPSEYQCVICQTTNVKLWRQYQTFEPKLYCAICAQENQKVSVDIDCYGCIKHNRLGITNCIENLVPAIPDEEEVGYWGLNADIPPEAKRWWGLLPTYPNT